jgi:hypothetical protein
LKGQKVRSTPFKIKKNSNEQNWINESSTVWWSFSTQSIQCVDLTYWNQFIGY